MDTGLRASLLAALAAASLLGHAAPAAAQDPPPPLPPSDAPLPPSDAPPPPPADRLPPPPPLAVTPPPAVEPPAAEPPSEARPSRDDARVLKGQTLVTPALLDSAFVSTYAGVAGELGRQSDDNSSFNIVTGHFLAGVSFGRVEVGLDASYAGFVVGDQFTAVQLGGQNAYDVRPGLRLRAFRGASSGTQLGLHAYGVFDSSTRLNPLRVLEAVTDQIQQIAADPARAKCLKQGQLDCALLDSAGNPFDAFGAMKVTRALYGGGLSASLAQAFGARFALQASVGLEVGHGTLSTRSLGTVGSTPVNVSVGVAPSLGFGPSVPLALMVEYRFDFTTEAFGTPSLGATPVGTNGTLRQGFAGGVYYTGRPELQIGAAFKGSFATNSSDGVAQPSTTAISGLTTMRYFF